MEPIKINMKSWHYWLAKKSTSFDEYCLPKDICTYRGKVIRGALILLAISVAAIGVANITIIPILVAVFYWIFDRGHLNDHTWYYWAVGHGTLLTILIIIGCVLNVAYRLFFNRYEEREDGFIKTAYKSWKEKHCSKVTFE